jgi:glycosyltransferase involved in cell wall biosynthesis
MKIVSVMTTSSSGGAEFAAVALLEALSERGHQTVMVSDQPQITEGSSVRAQAIDIGPKLASDTYLGLLLRFPLLLVQLRRALERESPYDVLLVHYKKEQLLAALLPRRLRSTLVWAEWGPIPFQMRRGLPRRIYVWASRRAALIMAISAGTQRSVAAVGVDEGKIVVVPNALRTESIRYSPEGRRRMRELHGIPAEAFVVGCVSRFHPKKRNDVVIDAVLGLEDDNVHLIMGGDGETEQMLRERAAPLGERAHFTRTPREEIADVLSCFDVMVFCPSPTEGAPRAIILGMLAQRPCLSGGAEGVDDLIEPEFGAIASPEHDPTALRALIARYIGDPQRIEREGAVARRRAEEVYAAPVVAERVEELLTAAGAGGSRLSCTAPRNSPQPQQ